MADIMAKTIKFPGLNNTYEFMQPDGSYPNLTAGNIISNDAYNEDTEPYLFRALPYKSKRLVEDIVGGTVNWNQLASLLDSTHWSSAVSGTTNVQFSDGVASFLGTVQYAGLSLVGDYRPPSLKNHKYFFTVTAKAGSNADLQARSFGGYGDINLSVTTDWTTASKVFDLPDGDLTLGNRAILLRDKRVSGWDTVSFKNVMLIDLTALFGSTIADYVYSLEQATEGSGIAWLKSYGFFTKPYYEYDSGILKSVNPTAHVTRGVNAWDEEWEVGGYWSDGSDRNTYNGIRSKNGISVLPNTNYYCSSTIRYIFMYDASGNKLSYRESVTSFTTPNNCVSIKFCTIDTYGTTYNNDICINISDPAINGKYFPYEEHSYPLDPNWVGRGIPKLDNGKLAFDGDLYPSDGNGISMYQTITFDGSEDWKASSNANRYFVDFTYPNFPYKRASDTKAMSYSEFNFYGAVSGSAYLPDQQFALWNPAVSSSPNLREAMFHDTTVADVAAWKAKLASRPITIIFETEQVPATAQPFEQYQVCETGGTEQYITTNGVPVGHDTKYFKDVITNIAGIPEPPSGNGTYELKLTVTDGVASYSWVAV